MGGERRAMRWRELQRPAAQGTNVIRMSKTQQESNLHTREAASLKTSGNGEIIWQLVRGKPRCFTRKELMI